MQNNEQQNLRMNDKPKLGRDKLLGTLCIIGTTLCYGFIPSLSFLSFAAGVKTETLLFDKFLYAAVLMWAYILIKRIPFKVDKDALKTMIAICLSYIGLATTLYLAFNYISGSLATIVSFTFPPIIIAIEMITKMEPVRLLKIVAVTLAMAGMVFIVGKPEMGGELIGIAFAFGTSICYVIYIMGLSAKSIKKMNSMVVAGYVLLSSAVVNFFRCIISGKPLFTSGFDQLGLILLLAIVCAFMAILLYCTGVKLVGPGNAAIINTFEPAVACVLGYLLIGDELTKNMLVGAALIIVAVLLANIPHGHKPVTKIKVDID